MDTIALTTPSGTIKGIEGENAYKFLGVRYATAERFCYPTVTTSLCDGIYDATKFGAACPQYRNYYDENTNNAFYHKEFREGSRFIYDEDCLYLNIFAPKSAVNCPVIIFIHGGNHTKGSADEYAFITEEYAKRGVILVTVNYRLNVFGLYADKEAAVDGVTGNYQFYDQLAAVSWVHDNIAAFGGNPQNITLMGQSAGAMSVQPLILSPLAKGLIKGAVMLSGGGVRVGPWKVDKIEKSYRYWAEVKKLAGCNTLEELKKTDAKTLFDAWNKSNPIKKLLYDLPHADGRLITARLPQMQKEDTNNIPVIIGVTKNDMVPIVLYLDALRYAKNENKKGVAVYLQYFRHNLPGDDKGAFHSCDIWYAFHTLEKSWRPFTEADVRLSDTVVDYYCNFAATQNPNGSSLPKWETAAENKEFMILDTDVCAMGRPPVNRLLLNTVANGGAKR